MGIFKKVKNSIYNPDYYRELEKKPFSYSLKYYIVLALIFSLLTTVIVSFYVVPQVKSFIGYFMENVVGKYPSELEIVVKNGKASTNVEEPYFLGMPEKWKGGFKYILAIDTKNTFSVENFLNYQATCLLTETSLACYDNKDIKITPLSDFPDAKINKGTVSSLINKVDSFAKFIYPLLIIFIFCAIFVFYLWRLAYLLIFSIAILIIAKLKKISIGYKKSYQLGLHLLTLPIILTFILDTIIRFTKIDFKIPFLFSIIFLLSAVINLRQQKAVVPVSQAEQVEVK